MSAPPAALSVSKGSADTTDCVSGCNYVNVSGTHFPANSVVSVAYDTDHGGNGTFVTKTYTTDGSGSFAASNVYFSYSGFHIWVAVGSTQSNTITW